MLGGGATHPASHGLGFRVLSFLLFKIGFRVQGPKVVHQDTVHSS